MAKRRVLDAATFGALKVRHDRLRPFIPLRIAFINAAKSARRKYACCSSNLVFHSRSTEKFIRSWDTPRAPGFGKLASIIWAGSVMLQSVGPMPAAMTVFPRVKVWLFSLGNRYVEAVESHRDETVEANEINYFVRPMLTEGGDGQAVQRLR